MSRKAVAVAVFAILLTASALVAFLLLGSQKTPLVITEDFERNEGAGFAEWNADADVPPDPNNPGNTVQWHVTRVANVSRSPAHSAEFFVDGTQDDGTIWLERKVAVGKAPGTRVKVSFWLYSEQESFNAIAEVVAYAGAVKPETEGDFSRSGDANQVSGWKEYSYTASVASSSPSDVWVAVGISVRWETLMTYYIDDVKIEVT